MKLSPELKAFIKRLPKAETHLHFEGALPLELLQRVRPEFKEPPASWAFNFKYRDFAHFEGELLDMAFSWFTSPERYAEAATIIYERLLEQNVKYLETSFASGVIEFVGVPGHEVVQAMKASCPPELELRVFMGIHHNGCGPKMRPIIEDSLTWPELDGIDLHGPEDRPLEPWSAEIWQAARDNGKFTKAHAGEFCGPEFVERVLDELKVTRIEHGIRAAEKPALLGKLSSEGIALDMCPISNHKLVPDYAIETNPIRKFIDAGICVTISTDDPICFGNTLCDEYEALAQYQNFSPDELRQLSKNGFGVALVDPLQRTDWEHQVDASSN